MTREDSKPTMELDLDAFLESIDSTDDEDEDDHHRSTVDQLLLNNSDGSSPSSSPRSDSAGVDFSVGSGIPQSNININTNPSDADSFEASRLTPSDDNFRRSKFGGLINRSNSDDAFTVSRQLPPLYAAVRNAKPGAALAAAAAASRSIPTPHAAAIKLRREKSGTEGLESKSSTGSEIIYQGVTDTDVKLVEEDVRLDNLETVGLDSIEKPDHLVFAGRDDTCEEVPTDVAKVKDFELDVGNAATLVSDDEPEITPLLDIEGQSSGEGKTIEVIVDRSDEKVDENGMESAPIFASQSTEVATEVGEDLATAISDAIDPGSIEPSELFSESGVARAGDVDMGQTDVSIDMGGGSLHQESKGSDESSGGKSSPSLKPLQLAEELEKKHAFTGLHWEEGAAAQPMRLEGVRRGTTVLGYFDISSDNTITRTISSPAFRRDHGTPQAVAVHLNYIAVGTSRGVIVVVPSKYSPHYADKLDAKMLMLGLQGDRSYAPVTSMTFNQQGDLLFAGYADGHYTVWDVQRVSAAKVVTEHKTPVLHMLYLGMDSQVTRQFNVVSGDSKGVVKLIRFSPSSWLNRFSISKTSTLLDESTSTVVCASPLLSDEGNGGPSTSNPVVISGIGSMMGGVVAGDWKPNEGLSMVEEGVVIFVTHQSALVAKVSSSTPEVYAQLPKPEGIREGSLPYSAWKHIAHLQGSATDNAPIKESETVALLAIAWDRQLQVAKLVKSEVKIYAKWTLESSAIGVAWLDDQMLVVLTSAAQLFLYARDGTVIHQTSFSADGTQGDDLIGYHTYFNNIFGNPEKAHHNYIAVRGATLYLLGPTHLIISRLLPWKERIEVLRKAGDWMGALNMAMTLYDGQAHGVFDLPRSLNDVQMAIMPYLVELLFAYVDEVFSYISVAFCNQIEKLEHLDSTTENTLVHSEIKEQYTRVGGVAVEFCVHIRRTDILFNEILSRFESVQQKETFLELLEPYILKDMLGSLPPEVMQVLVEHYSAKGWLQRVEQCVLHMDISSLDFNQVVRLCREHRLYGALIYLFNKGLDDFRTPLEELLVVLLNSNDESAAALGYRMLVYLKYCFSGLAFPPGHGTLSPSRLPSLRMELIHFLLEDSNAPSLSGERSLSSKEQYKNLYHLLELDTEATLEVLRCAFMEAEIPNLDHELALENDSISHSHNLVQKIVDALAFILEASRSLSSRFVQADTIWPSKDDTANILDFIADHVGCGDAKVSNELLGHIFEYLTLVADVAPNISRRSIDSLRTKERKVLALLEVVPVSDWDDTYLLSLCEKAQFYQVCGFIHESRQLYIAALESYMKDVDEPLHAFSFVDDLLRRPSNKNPDSLEAAVISRIPDLVQISREGTYFLIVQHLSQENQQILAELQSRPKSLFLYLKTVLEVHSTGTLNFSALRSGHSLDIPSRRRVKNQSDRVQEFLERISDFPKFLRENPVHVTDEMTEMYLELLCQYERNSVLQFLETCESYRVEYCLRLCQEHGIIDAAAFLLERVGDVGSALLFTLSDLMDRFRLLDAAVRRVLDCSGMDSFNAILKMDEVNDIMYIVRTCVGLCQRNSPRLDPDESESLWFQLLDSFCEPLMESFVSKIKSEDEDHSGTPTELLSRQKDGEAFIDKWKVTGSNKGANILRKLFSIFIRAIVEGMIGFVRLPTIMMKLLSDNGSQEFGDFKVTILGMLGTYDFERRILDTAKSLIEDDTYSTMRLLKKGASHGYGPHKLLCCICNCLLTKESSTSGIRVFSCGHASHLHCDLQAKETSHRGYSIGCPLCMPKKKGPSSKSNSVFGENGLVAKPSSKNKLLQGTGSAHLHENDALNRQISRFEILSNLQKNNKMIQIDNMPQLKLAPPAVYHDKVKKGIDILRGETSSGSAKVEKTKASKKVRDLKVKGSAVRFPLKSNIFGKEKTKQR